MDMPVDYHVWDAMLEHCRMHMPRLTNIMLRYILSTIWNDLLHEFINQAIVSYFCNRFRLWVAATGGQ